LNEKQRHFDLTLTAVANPARRSILERVMKKESRVTELARAVAMSLNAVSKHIRILERAGLVSRRRVWRQHRVSFNSEPLEEVSAWIEKSHAFWTARLDALDELVKAEDAAATQQPAKVTQQPAKKGKPKWRPRILGRSSSRAA
jgi:predicted transcriptional regulator